MTFYGVFRRVYGFIYGSNKPVQILAVIDYNRRWLVIGWVFASSIVDSVVVGLTSVAFDVVVVTGAAVA